jgi:hypothetical protein
LLNEAKHARIEQKIQKFCWSYSINLWVK